MHEPWGFPSSSRAEGLAERLLAPELGWCYVIATQGATNTGKKSSLTESFISGAHDVFAFVFVFCVLDGGGKRDRGGRCVFHGCLVCEGFLVAG